MKTQNFESTYALLLRSEEKERSYLEAGVYLLLIACMAFSIWQAAQQRVTIPTNFRTAAITQTARVQPRNA